MTSQAISIFTNQDSQVNLATRLEEPKLAPFELQIKLENIKLQVDEIKDKNTHAKTGTVYFNFQALPLLQTQKKNPNAKQRWFTIATFVKKKERDDLDLCPGPMMQEDMYELMLYNNSFLVMRSYLKRPRDLPEKFKNFKSQGFIRLLIDPLKCTPKLIPHIPNMMIVQQHCSPIEDFYLYDLAVLWKFKDQNGQKGKLSYLSSLLEITPLHHLLCQEQFTSVFPNLDEVEDTSDQTIKIAPNDNLHESIFTILAKQQRAEEAEMVMTTNKQEGSMTEAELRIKEIEAANAILLARLQKMEEAAEKANKLAKKTTKKMKAGEVENEFLYDADVVIEEVEEEEAEEEELKPNGKRNINTRKQDSKTEKTKKLQKISDTKEIKKPVKKTTKKGKKEESSSDEDLVEVVESSDDDEAPTRAETITPYQEPETHHLRSSQKKVTTGKTTSTPIQDQKKQPKVASGVKEIAKRLNTNEGGQSIFNNEDNDNNDDENLFA